MINEKERPESESLSKKLRRIQADLKSLPTVEITGRIEQAIGTLIESSGPPAGLGSLCLLDPESESPTQAEVVGFRGNKLLLMPLEKVGNLASGSPVKLVHKGLTFGFSEDIKGRVIDGLGRPMDGRPLPPTERNIPFDNVPPQALSRPTISQNFDTGVRVIDSLLTLGEGQRVGVFAGSGVGKSTLMGMLARGSQSEVNVIGLIGERGREVGDFVNEQLGPDGLKRSVVVAATSDRSPMERIKGAMLTVSIAEAFRDRGYKVCLMMDSVTRVAMAQREVGLAVGEPPTSRGYTPSVFSLLPRLLERTGPGPTGDITGIFTVLVEGDDLNDPVADTVRGILDGHIVLSRELAHRGHFPAIDVLGSVSRVMPALINQEHAELARRLRELIADLKDAKELQALGGYHPGASPALDHALAKEAELHRFLRQNESDPRARDLLLSEINQLFQGEPNELAVS